MAFADQIDLDELRSCPGVQDVRSDEARVSFNVSGSPDPVLKVLAKHQVADLEFDRPSVEEVFLTYYEGDSS